MEGHEVFRVLPPLDSPQFPIDHLWAKIFLRLAVRGFEMPGLGICLRECTVAPYRQAVASIEGEDGNGPWRLEFGRSGEKDASLAGIFLPDRIIMFYSSGRLCVVMTADNSVAPKHFWNDWAMMLGPNVVLYGDEAVHDLIHPVSQVRLVPQLKGPRRAAMSPELPDGLEPASVMDSLIVWLADTVHKPLTR